MKNTTEIGNRAERVAEKFYLDLGYQLHTRNFRCTRGELDLIFTKERELLVVEVKGRTRFEPDEAWVTRWRGKKRKMLTALRFFLRDGGLARFDQFRLEIVFVTQGRVSERFEGEPFF